MKRLIVLISVLCLIAVALCGCGKKKNKDGSESGTSTQTSGTESQISMTEGVDEISVSDAEENAVVIDFDTGSVISAPSDKNNSSSSNSSVTVSTPSLMG